MKSHQLLIAPLLSLCVTLTRTKSYGQEFRYPDKIAVYKGDSGQTFYDVIYAHFKYPMLSRLNCKQGKIFVQFVVRKDGTMDEVKCVNSIDMFIDAQAEESVRMIGDNWKPASMDGELVDSRMVIPINLKHNNPQCQKEQDKKFEKGLHFFESKRYVMSLKQFNAVLDLEPTHQETLLKTGLIHYYLDDLNKACSTWMFLRNLGNAEVNDLIKEYCKQDTSSTSY